MNDETLPEENNEEELCVDNEDNKVDDKEEPFTPRVSLNISEKYTDTRCTICGRTIKRRYITRTVWGIILLIIIILIPLTSFTITASFALIAITFTTLFNFLSMYITTNPNYFTYDAYVSVILSYSIIGIKMVIVIFDLSKNGLGSSKQKSTVIESSSDKAIYIIWTIVYWFSIIFNFVILMFQRAYLKQGHPKFLKRIWYTILYLKIIIIVGFVLIVVIAITFFILKHYGIINDAEKWYTQIVIAVELVNMIFCEFIFVILFGIGLVYFPFKFLRYTSSIYNLKKVIKDFVKFKSSYELSVNKFNKNAQYLIELCNKVKKVYSVPEDLAAYCTKIITTLEIEITHNFATFNDFIEYNPNIFANFTDKYGTDLVSLYPIEEISKMYIIVQTYYYLCIKKKTLLFDSYLTIRNNAETFGEKTIFYQNDKMKEKIHKKNLFQGTKNYLVLPKEHKILVKIGTKLFGGFLILISFVLYFVQIFMLVISLLSKESRTKVNDFLNVNDSTILIIIFFGYFAFIILASFYSLTRVRKIDDYILVIHNSDRFTMIKNSRMTNKILLGIIYNFLFFSINLDPSSSENNSNQLSHYFKSFKQYTVLQKCYGIGFPVLLTIIIVFAVLSQFGYNLEKMYKYIFKKEDEELNFKKEVRELYKDGEFFKKESVEYLCDENMLFIIERFEKEFLDEICSI